MKSPEYILVSPAFAAALSAQVKFDGRDRRRIKRDVNKALRLARRQPVPSRKRSISGSPASAGAAS